MQKYHRTAMSRKNFSTPVQYLLKKDLINKDVDILDYGCGRGYDVEHLNDDNYNVIGYDPNGKYADANIARTFQIVMCNFVLNVIQDADERLAVENDLIDHLIEGGVAYISVRNDSCVANGCTSTGTWQGLVEPVNEGWELIVSNSKFKMWKYYKVTR